MNIRYFLPLLALLLALPAQAQRGDEQFDAELVINTPPELATTISNFNFDYPAAYTVPDTSASIFLGVTVFTSITADGDTVGVGTVYTEEGVTGDVVVAVDGEGGITEGCFDGDIDNDISGQIVMIARGTCNFTDKFGFAEALGAIGVIIYNPDYRPDPNVITGNLGGGQDVDPIGIPGVLIPNGFAQPLVDALLGGGSANATIRRALIVAVEDTPEASAAAFRVSGSNPFSSSTSFKVSLDEPEAIAIEVYSVQGRRVATLHNGLMAAGETTVDFVASDLPSGTYLVRATGEKFSQTRTVSVVR